MAKSVSLFTMIDGEAVNVGTCHPGQARVLRKNGTAEWREGKLWLKIPQKAPEAPFDLGDQTAPGMYPTHARRDREYLEQDGVELVGSVSAVPNSVKAGHLAKKVFDEIDPDGVLRGKGRVERKEVKFPTAESFFLSLKLRLDDKHNLWACDAPRQISIGYVDDTLNEWLLLPLTKFKDPAGQKKAAEIMGMEPETLREIMKSPAGRASLVGTVEWTAHLSSVLTEALGTSEEVDLDTFQEMWDRGHKRETLEAFGEHLPISKRLTVATKKVNERRAIRGDLQPPKGWAIAQWPRDKSRIDILNQQGKSQNPPPGDPFTAGAYRRKGSHLVRVWPNPDGMSCYWEAASMEKIWEITTVDPETGEETVEKLDRPATGKYISQKDPQVVDSWETAYQAADAWLLVQD